MATQSQCPVQLGLEANCGWSTYCRTVSYSMVSVLLLRCHDLKL